MRFEVWGDLWIFVFPVCIQYTLAYWFLSWACDNQFSEAYKWLESTTIKRWDFLVHYCVVMDEVQAHFAHIWNRVHLLFAYLCLDFLERSMRQRACELWLEYWILIGALLCAGPVSLLGYESGNQENSFLPGSLSPYITMSYINNHIF